jgi:hypothetical protein
MRIRHALYTSLIVATTCLLAVQGLRAQAAPARGRGAAAGRAATTGRAASAVATRQAPATMLQLMRGILFPNSNIIFAAQNDDFAKTPLAKDPSLATDPITSLYGGWQAAENAGLALAESANLLTIPRSCSNGKPAPVQNADWQKFVQGLRAAGLEAYKAAQAKKTDAFLDVADHVTLACGNCHDVYREKTDQQGGLKARCTK